MDLSSCSRKQAGMHDRIVILPMLSGIGSCVLFLYTHMNCVVTVHVL